MRTRVCAQHAVEMLGLAPFFEQEVQKRKQVLDGALANAVALPKSAIEQDKEVELNPTPDMKNIEPVQGLDMNNKATQMMLKMGWVPGKALADGGLVVPIEANANWRRSGLGLQGQQQGRKGHTPFMVECRALLKEFLDSPEIAMSIPGLSKEQRGVVHKLARSMRLSSKSVGNNLNRCIAIFRPSAL